LVLRATQAPLVVPVLRQNSIADFSHCIGGLGLFVKDGGSTDGILQLVHGLQLYPGVPGHSRDQLQNFGYEGDVMGVNVATIAFNEMQLVIIRDVIMPGTVESVRQLLLNDPTATMMGPFTEDDVNVRTTKTRAIAYFPFKLMELLLEVDLNVWQVYELVVPALIQSGLEETCSVFIDFFTVALVAPTAAAPTPLVVHQQVWVDGYIPGPATISFHCKAILYGDLPLLHPVSSAQAASDPAPLDIVRGVQDMVTEARAERNDRQYVRVEARRPWTVCEHMGDAITDHLNLLCHAANDEELPALYHAWGGSERWFLQ
jgi:hypothetical protein